MLMRSQPNLKEQNVTAGLDSCDLGRAFIAAYIVAEYLNFTQPIMMSSQLRQVDLVEASGQILAEAEMRYHGLQNDTAYVPPQGESLSQMQTRVMSFLVQLAANNEGRTAVISTHDSVINAIYSAYAKIDLGPYNAEHYNAHDFVACVTIQDRVITSFKENQ